ncbi:glycoside hydrolase family 32 protein [Corynebacterium pyruviciproducens]|uniref:beta-fructofuranosidase n=1 Tax=Corynebacterium pyruviciproducens TaxID=598660 RepID=A0AAF0YV14_9CORY|nr:glycoside hydrolase family 32 protein [Corynebacterium pyruviciproducens]WOT01978.1 glycoside hydrolase family 32 protein [Corynebacterium pyruviciproducens]
MTYRPLFHLTAPTGRLNDPNGVTLLGDQLHVFYQHDPAYGIGPKRTGWGHAVTSLSTGGGACSDAWRHLPDALYPDAPYDKNGVYSGGSVTLPDGSIQLFYTGNLKVDGLRHATQNRVFVTDLSAPTGGSFRRDPSNPLIDAPAPGFTNHFRDPQIIQLADGHYRMALGAQSSDGHGHIVIYYSRDLAHWEFAGPLVFEGLSPRLAESYMWECPNLIRLRDSADGQWYDLAVFCPQFEGSDECVWVLGTLEGLTFNVIRDAAPVDHGHQFYAPQLIELSDGTALMLGWMGLPGKDDAPTFEAEGWLHCLTVPRRVTLRAGELYQEFLTSAPLTSSHPAVTWDPATRTVTVNDAHAPRSAHLPDGIDPDLRILADSCALEVIAGGGLVAFSSMLY